MTPKGALAFLRRHGIVLETARGAVPSLAEAIVATPIKGGWWSHRKSREIFRLTRGLRDSKDVLVCRLVGGKITFVHRRLWPALARLAYRFPRANLAALTEIHTPQGRHVLRLVPFARWVPTEVKRRAARLSESDAVAALGIFQKGG
ncbi:MAG: hypothetical protein ACHQX4_04785 [Gemmatimonadales bacterium]